MGPCHSDLNYSLQENSQLSLDSLNFRKHHAVDSIVHQKKKVSKNTKTENQQWLWSYSVCGKLDLSSWLHVKITANCKLCSRYVFRKLLYLANKLQDEMCKQVILFTNCMYSQGPDMTKSPALVISGPVQEDPYGPHKGPYGPIRVRMGPNPDRAPTRTGPQPGPGPLRCRHSR